MINRLLGIVHALLSKETVTAALPAERYEVSVRTLSTASGEKEILHKLGNFFRTELVNWIAIDFSGWGDEQKQIYEDIRRVILTGKVICFDYYGKNREVSRRMFLWRIC